MASSYCLAERLQLRVIRLRPEFTDTSSAVRGRLQSRDPISCPEAVCNYGTCLLAIHGAVPGPCPALVPSVLLDPLHSSSVQTSVAFSTLQDPARSSSCPEAVCNYGTCLLAIHGAVPEPCPSLVPSVLLDLLHSSSVQTSVAFSTLQDPARSSSVWTSVASSSLPDLAHCSSVRTGVASSAHPDPAHSSPVWTSVASSTLADPAHSSSVWMSVVSSMVSSTLPDPARSSSVRTSLASSPSWARLQAIYRPGTRHLVVPGPIAHPGAITRHLAVPGPVACLGAAHRPRTRHPAAPGPVNWPFLVLFPDLYPGPSSVWLPSLPVGTFWFPIWLRSWAQHPSDFPESIRDVSSPCSQRWLQELMKTRLRRVIRREIIIPRAWSSGLFSSFLCGCRSCFFYIGVAVMVAATPSAETSHPGRSPPMAPSQLHFQSQWMDESCQEVQYWLNFVSFVANLHSLYGLLEAPSKSRHIRGFHAALEDDNQPSPSCRLPNSAASADILADMNYRVSSMLSGMRSSEGWRHGSHLYVPLCSWLNWWTYVMKFLSLKSTDDTRLVRRLFLASIRCQLIAKTASTLWASSSDSSSSSRRGKGMKFWWSLASLAAAGERRAQLALACLQSCGADAFTVAVLRDRFQIPFHHLPPVARVPRELSSYAAGSVYSLAL